MTGARLRWEQRGPTVWAGYSGKMVMAIVSESQTGSGEREVWFEMRGIDTRRKSAAYGVAKTIEKAMEAADASWSAWLAEAGLQPVA